jgi:hypothetical protein
MTALPRPGRCVWAGDADREETHEVVDGNAPGLVLSLTEALWLQFCWSAAIGAMPKLADKE